MSERQNLINHVRNNLRAAAAYRQRIWNRPDVPVYDCGEDTRFANAMWHGCMDNVRNAILMLKAVK